MHQSYPESIANDRYQAILREVEEDRLARLVARRETRETRGPNALSWIRSLLRTYRIRVSITRQAA
jgi:hypothetical protein